MDTTIEFTCFNTKVKYILLSKIFDSKHYYLNRLEEFRQNVGILFSAQSDIDFHWILLEFVPESF